MTLTFDEQRTEEQKAYDAAVMERVKAGMALLEEKYGPEWVEHLDLGSLSLRGGNSCVLGQLYGGYSYGLMSLWPSGDPFAEGHLRELSHTIGVEHGFFAADAETSDDHLPEWQALQAAWEDALTPRVTRT